MTFGEALAQARDFRELRLVDLARKMGRKDSYAANIRNTEQGKLNAGTHVIVEYASALDVTFFCRPDGWSFKPQPKPLRSDDGE